MSVLSLGALTSTTAVAAMRWLLPVAALLVLYAGAYQLGALNERADAHAKAVKAEAAQAKATQQVIARAQAEGQTAMAQLSADLGAARTYSQLLEKRLQHVSTLVFSAGRAVAGPGAAVADVLADVRAAGRPAVVAALGGTSGQPPGPAAGTVAALAARDAGATAPALAAAPAAGTAAPTAAAPVAENPGADLRLTLAAVSLWDSALAGADVSVAACRADEPASEACAADSGVGLNAVWANHAVNAFGCAADRARLATMISLLCKRPGQEGCARE